MSERLDAWRAGLRAPHLAARDPLKREWEAAGLHASAPIGDMLAAGVARKPDTRLVFVSQERPTRDTNIAALHADVLAAARGYASLGIERGDAIVVQVPNWEEGVIATLAAFHAGIVIIPLVHICGASELGFILHQTRAKALIVPDYWRNIDFTARVRDLGDVPDLIHIIVIGDGAMPPRAVTWQDMLARGRDTRGNEALGNDTLGESPDATDICMVNFTSGTTASPKGAMHSHQTICAEIFTTPMIIPEGDGFTFWPTPAGHIGAIISYLRPYLLGENSVYLDQVDVAPVVDTMARYPVRQGGGSTFHLRLFLDHVPARNLAKLENFVVGMTTVPPDLATRAHDLGFSASRCYGLTEHPTVTGCAPEESLECRAATDGRPTAGNQVRVVDEHGADVPNGEQGEVLTMGPELMIGYLDPALNATAFDKDGWFRTGDIGVLDADGYLMLVDRKKDIIIRGGENISSREVEELVCRHPAVLEAAAIGWPDVRLGERVGVFVRVHPGAAFDVDIVGSHFASCGVARQKTPEFIEIVDDFPRTAVGKVNKTLLRKLLAGTK